MERRSKKRLGLPFQDISLKSTYFNPSDAHTAAGLAGKKKEGRVRGDDEAAAR